jgi:phosphonate metabolism protein PhnN/1,5-bisphosphokinase (PRPP-forming)
LPSVSPPPVLPSTLFLVVGPSGAGKDTLIDAAKSALAGNPLIVFPRRFITRAADAVGEDHIGVSDDEFEAGLASGGYSLHWPAHGLRYALPASIDDDLAAGRSVVANVSRSVVTDAHNRYGDVRVVYVTASPEVLAARLKNRGRESAPDIDQRLARDSIDFPPAVDVIEIRNDGSLRDTVCRFLEALGTPVSLPTA